MFCPYAAIYKGIFTIIANIMQAINIVLEMFSSVRTRREVRCTITRAAIGNCVVGMCSYTMYVRSYILYVWELRSTWDGAVHFLRTPDER